MKQAMQVALDYSALTPVERECLASAISRINGFVRTSAQVYLEIGITLREVQGRFQHSFFSKWAAAELPWSYATTRKLIYVAEAFEGRTVERFQPAALYVLSWPSVSQQAREHAFECVNDGDEITKEKAKDIVAMYRGHATPKTEKKRLYKIAGEDPLREDIGPIKSSASSWSNLEKLVNECRVVHLSKNEDCEFGDIVYTVTTYPEDDAQKIGVSVRRNLDDAVAAASGNEAKKQCYLCKRTLNVSFFTYCSTTKDKRARACRDCENARGREQKERRKAKRKAMAA